MLSLEAAQANFIDTINDGPDALDHTLFDGPIDRVMLGLKAHANTISHARLVALEETFPLTRQALGEEQFNQLSRAYAETPEARTCDANTIGKAFPNFLQTTPAGQPIIELACIEWAWLESYHAAEALPLAIEDLATLSEAALLEQLVNWHPATRLIPISRPLPNVVPELDSENAKAILIVRPDANVRLLALDAVTFQITKLAEKSTTVGNLLAFVSEQVSVADPIGPVLTLIGAGALVVME
jgi:hypothetical protein